MGAWGRGLPGSPLHRKRDSLRRRATACQCRGLLANDERCQRAALPMMDDDMMTGSIANDGRSY